MGCIGCFALKTSDEITFRCSTDDEKKNQSDTTLFLVAVVDDGTLPPQGSQVICINKNI